MLNLTDTLKNLRGGEADSSAGAALAELIHAVRATGRAGSLVLELKIKPVTANDGSQVIVEEIVKLKKPAPRNAMTVLFTTENAELQTRDPRQPELKNFREPGAAGPAAVRDFPTSAPPAAPREAANS